MGQCVDCPRLTDAVARCCMDEPMRGYTFDVARERDALMTMTKSDSMLFRIPGRSAERGEVTHKKFADMNRKERRAFLSGRK